MTTRRRSKAEPTSSSARELLLADALRELTGFSTAQVDSGTTDSSSHLPSVEFRNEFLERVDRGEIKLTGEKILTSGATVEQKIPPLLSLRPLVDWELSIITDVDSTYINVRAVEAEPRKSNGGRPSQHDEVTEVVKILREEGLFRRVRYRDKQCDEVRERAQLIYPDVFSSGSPGDSAILTVFRELGIIRAKRGHQKP